MKRMAAFALGSNRPPYYHIFINQLSTADCGYIQFSMQLTIINLSCWMICPIAAGNFLCVRDDGWILWLALAYTNLLAPLIRIEFA